MKFMSSVSNVSLTDIYLHKFCQLQFETISHFQVVVKVAPVSKELSWCTMNEIQNNWGLKNSFLNYWEIDFDNMIR